MFTPFTQIATAMSFFVSAQIALPPVSRLWVSEPTHRCSAVSHNHRADRVAAKKRKAAGGGSASPSIQIVTFGP
jgi:hypothetical protein